MNVSNENKERSRVSKVRYCKKSKKEVSDDPFVSSWQRVCVMTDCAATWLSPSSHISASIAF